MCCVLEPFKYMTTSRTSQVYGLKVVWCMYAVPIELPIDKKRC